MDTSTSPEVITIDEVQTIKIEFMEDLFASEIIDDDEQNYEEQFEVIQDSSSSFTTNKENETTVDETYKNNGADLRSSLNTQPQSNKEKGSSPIFSENSKRNKNGTGKKELRALLNSRLESKFLKEIEDFSNTRNLRQKTLNRSAGERTNSGLRTRGSTQWYEKYEKSRKSFEKNENPQESSAKSPNPANSVKKSPKKEFKSSNSTITFKSEPKTPSKVHDTSHETMVIPVNPKVEEPDTFECKRCSKTFKSFVSIQYHNRSYHKRGKPGFSQFHVIKRNKTIFKCEGCQQNVRYHIHRAHMTNFKKYGFCTKKICFLCHKPYHATFDDHFIEKHPNERVPCEFCIKNFKNLMSCRKHMSKVHCVEYKAWLKMKKARKFKTSDLNETNDIDIQNVLVNARNFIE